MSNHWFADLSQRSSVKRKPVLARRSSLLVVVTALGHDEVHVGVDVEADCRLVEWL